MMVGQSNICVSGRWLQLSKPSKFVHCGVLVTEMSVKRGWRGQAWHSDACLHGVFVALRPSAQAPPAVAHRSPHCVQ